MIEVTITGDASKFATSSMSGSLLPEGDMPRVFFVVHDKPTGKGRPRSNFKTGRVYTDSETIAAEKRVRDAFIESGEVMLPRDVALGIDLIFYLKRPDGHYLRDGKTLSTAGKRAGLVFSRKKPDWDNASKLVCDALEGYAYPHDAAIARGAVTKLWTDTSPRIIVKIEPLLVEWEALNV